MMFWIALLPFAAPLLAETWPYARGILMDDGRVGKLSTADITDVFAQWLQQVFKSEAEGELRKPLKDETVPQSARFIDELFGQLQVPDDQDWASKKPEHPTATSPDDGLTAEQALGHLPCSLDQQCTKDQTKWMYRTYEGDCNWIKRGESSKGKAGQSLLRDFGQNSYNDGISQPRDGPNARAVSRAFFRRKKTLYYEHTLVLIGLVELIMYNVTYSQDSKKEYVDIPMPTDEADFLKNTTLRVDSTAAAKGTGTAKVNLTEPNNMASTWIDVSALYGSSEQVARKLRTFRGGKLITQEIRTRGQNKASSYLPFNSMDVPTNSRQGMSPVTLFAGGDARTNEDWMMLAIHALLLREHNRLCDIFAAKFPDWDDEKIYQNTRILMGARLQLIWNAYQMTYFKDAMPWPADDGFALYRVMNGGDFLDINLADTYPCPLVTKNGKPMVVSAEMTVVYRFHELITPGLPIKDALNETLWDQKLFEADFNATGSIDAGLENVLRGMASVTTPNYFKSGIDEAFRTSNMYRGTPFDPATWSVVHEREQGLPTFDAYFRAYNAGDPKVVVPIREKFSDFSSDPDMVARLERPYDHPDDVDLSVGVQLKEETFPHTTMPKSSLIVSLFGLFGTGNSDRFNAGFAVMHRLLVHRPWNCAPSNALHALIWKSDPRPGFPRFRTFLDQDWMKELDLRANGGNLLRRLITENSEIECLPKDPLYPADKETNPLMCRLPEEGTGIIKLATTAIKVILAWMRNHKGEVVAIRLTALLACMSYL